MLEFKSSCILKKYSNNNKKIKRSNSFYFNEVDCKLEMKLLKLQKRFNPNLLKDEDLKYDIIKEIVECQRLLLTKNIHSKSLEETQISMNEIYDEW
jgi:hypothetical protein